MLKINGFMGNPSKFSDQENQEINVESERIINLLKQAIGVPMKEIPAPPFTQWLNGKLLSVSRGEIEIEFIARPEMANPARVLHGGAQSAILDDTIGVTCATLGYKGFLITIDFYITFLGRIPVNSVIRAHGKIIREGKNIIHAVATISSVDGQLYAQGSSNLLRTEIRPDYLKQDN